MANLIGMVALALATVALWLSRSRNWAARHPLTYRAALIAAYVWTLLLALRFGARTYPGVWMGRSDLLNDIFNGGQIFWIGYDFVLVAALADGLSILLGRGSTSAARIGVRAASTTRNVCLLFATLGVIYGFYFAIAMGRLPA